MNATFDTQMYLSLGFPFVVHTPVAEGDHLSSLDPLFADLLTTDHFEHVHWIAPTENSPPLHGECGLQPFGSTYLQFSSDYYCLLRYIFLPRLFGSSALEAK